MYGKALSTWWQTMIDENTGLLNKEPMKNVRSNPSGWCKHRAASTLRFPPRVSVQGMWSGDQWGLHVSFQIANVKAVKNQEGGKNMEPYMVVFPSGGEWKRDENTLNAASCLEPKCRAPIVNLQFLKVSTNMEPNRSPTQGLLCLYWFMFRTKIWEKKN